MRIRNFFMSTKIGRAISAKFLTTPFLVNNAFYKRVYMYHIRRKADQLAREMPEISVETTNACNARCIMCAHNQMTRPVGTMSMNLFHKIVANCERLGINSIGLSFFGEPLLDKYFFERLKFVKERGFNVNFFSNASLLTPEYATKLIELRCDSVHFSIDGFSSNVYESIRVGLNRDIVYDNVNKLLNLKSKYNSELPRITITAIVMDKNRHEAKKLYKYWHSRQGVNNVLLTNLRDWGEKQPDGDIGELGRFCQSDLWRPPCIQLWKGLNVYVDGTVPLCCDVIDGEFILGNLNSQSIEDIWFGTRLKRLRDLHLNDNMDDIPICRSCSRITVWW